MYGVFTIYGGLPFFPAMPSVTLVLLIGGLLHYELLDPLLLFPKVFVLELEGVDSLE